MIEKTFFLFFILIIIVLLFLFKKKILERNKKKENCNCKNKNKNVEIIKFYNGEIYRAQLKNNPYSTGKKYNHYLYFDDFGEQIFDIKKMKELYNFMKNRNSEDDYFQFSNNNDE